MWWPGGTHYSLILQNSNVGLYACRRELLRMDGLLEPPARANHGSAITTDTSRVGQTTPLRDTTLGLTGQSIRHLHGTVGTFTTSLGGPVIHQIVFALGPLSWGHHRIYLSGPAAPLTDVPLGTPGLSQQSAVSASASQSGQAPQQIDTSECTVHHTKWGSPASRDRHSVARGKLSAALEPSTTKSPPVSPAPGPEPKPAVDSLPAPRKEPQPAATADVKCSQDIGTSPAPPASTVLVPAQRVLQPSRHCPG
ncbi:hypothetical protein J4Q44_G00300590 [Coregonus suidteri]|uniref:Uncharacterized protein n=1 Tax=Coregonus suidteri TaxID=861788 RepID=A0AAN8L5U9_9TELE